LADNQDMADTTAFPSFVEEADGRHPGILAEYSALKTLVRPLFEHRESDEFRHTVMLQAAIIWQHYNAILLLLAYGFGIQGLVLCRTLFEIVVGTLFLMKNPDLLTDFMDHGKLLFYEQCLAGGISSRELAKIAPECEAIKARQKGRRKSSWHGSRIDKIAVAVGLGETYELLYRDASSATHADAVKTLSHGPRGWRQTLESFRNVKEADLVNYNAFFLTGHVLSLVNRNLDVGHEKEANAVLILMTQRARTAAMPN
jgi:hypothetical protein